MRYDEIHKGSGGRSDEELVAEALARVSHIANQSEKARRLGVSESTVRRWLAGELSTPLRKATRVPLERFLAGYAELGSTFGFGKDDGEPNTPAEQLLRHLEARAGQRRTAHELTDKDLIAAAYTIARKDAWPVEELRMLDAWRDAILGALVGD